MAEHSVQLKISQPINVENRDVEFIVRIDDHPRGVLKVSRGTVDWMPSPNKRTHYKMKWDELARLMEEYGRKAP